MFTPPRIVRRLRWALLALLALLLLSVCGLLLRVGEIIW